MIRFELHTHTEASPDSKSKIQDIIRQCEKKKIDAIAITDHDVPFDMKRLKGIKTDVVVIPAIEVSTIDDSHIIGLFIETPIKAKKHLEVIDEIHKKGGIAIMAHPFRTWQGYMTPLIKRTKSDVEAVLNKIDAVEMYNAKTTPDENKKSAEFFTSRGIPILAGSDAHTPKEIGNAVVELDAEIKDLRTALTDAKREIIINKRHMVFEAVNHSLRKTGRKALEAVGIKKGSKEYKKLREGYLNAAKAVKKGLGRK